MKRFFLMDFWGVDRLTVNTYTKKEAEAFFRDVFGYFADVVKLIDSEGATIKTYKGA